MTVTDTKKPLLISFLTIALCISLLVGTTYAWFSNIGDSSITVNATSGILDVDIVDIAGESLLEDYLTFVTTSTHSTLNVEPGSTFYTIGFKIKNVGNVKMRYIMSINIDKTSRLAEVLDFWLVEAPNDSGELTKTDIANKVPITDYEGFLGPQQTSKTYHLVMTVKTEADNTFQNLVLERMGITVDATQANSN